MQNIVEGQAEGMRDRRIEVRHGHAILDDELTAFIGLAMALRVGYVRLVDARFSAYNSVLAAFFVMGGVQMLCTSIMCAYISRIYIEVQQRPYYIVGEVLEEPGLDSEPENASR